MMSREKEPLWQRITKLEGKVRCKFYHDEFAGGIAHQMRCHLANVASKDVQPCHF